MGLLVLDIVDRHFRTNFPVDIGFGAGVLTVATRLEFVQSNENGESLFYEVSSHTRASGHQLIAKILYNNIMAKGVLPVAAK